MIATFWNGADASPFSIADLEDLKHELLRRLVSVTIQNSRILILYFAAFGLQLANGHQCSLQNVDWLEAADNNGHVEFGADRFVFFITHDRADVAWSEETLHAIFWRLQNGRQRRGNKDMRYQ